ncbi:hypothetical protein [Pseudofrankia sp. BMG5.37]|uniref:hypothetical protein n=1 Tax=Pseudofrankia sp. BMG5.37 TaxID=3050035 RepID=UPI0028944A06|nr:hypothetical protein [Pseudofrankia sp. BMG5.37]MDT3445816.1 hypothetical protein [Pseudofrankia sp. BMG5.37]
MTGDPTEQEDGGTAMAADSGQRPAGVPDAEGGVSARPWTEDDWALVVGSGSDLAELYEQIARLPTGLAFVEAFGDVDLVLVYRPAGEPRSRRELLDAIAGRVVSNGGMLVGSDSPDVRSGGERFMTPAERAAFAAGQADALSAMRRALTGMRGRRTGGSTVPVTA